MLAGEVRHTIRGLIRRPGFALAAVLTLGLGIGANTAIFSAVWQLLLAPLPFPDGDRMGYVWNSSETGFQLVPSVEQAEAIEQGARTLERVEPYSRRSFSWRGAGTTELVAAGIVTPSMPATLGVRPVIGRAFLAEETRAGGAAVALVSETFWRTRLGESLDVLDSAIRLDGETYAVVGVMPDRFGGYDLSTEALDLWIPLVDGMEDRLSLLVVRRDGIPVEQVNAELNAISANVSDGEIAGEQLRTRLLVPRDFLGTSTRTALLILLGAVGLVLLIACGNVAGLLLVRGTARAREFAVRAALGASRLRIIQQLAVEALVLALAGGAIGLLLGAWGIDLIRTIRPSSLQELAAVSLDPEVLAFTAGVTALTALMFGLMPAIRSARPDLTAQFGPAGGWSTHAARVGRAGAVLVVAEVALAVVLLVGASLLVRTMASLRATDLGFDATGVLAFSLSLPEARYTDTDARKAFAGRLGDALRATPGAASVSISTGVPPRQGIMFGELTVEGSDQPTGDRLLAGATVDGHYFRTLGMTIVEGRGFGDDPAADANGVVLNRSTADRLWPDGSAVGRRIRIGDPDRASWRTVIGVIADARVGGPAARIDGPQVYLPLTSPYPFLTVAVRSDRDDPMALVPPIRAVLERLDPDLPLRNLTTVEQMLAESVSRQQFNMILFSAFAGLALLLSAVGLYGIIAYRVSRRTRELGIRAALGAAPGGVLGLVLRQGMRLAAGGAMLGAITAWWLTGLMQNLLHGVEPRDAPSFAAAVVVVIAVAMLATWAPALRASRVDPVIALRTE